MNLFQRYKKYTYRYRIPFSLLFFLLIAGPASRAQNNNVLLTGRVYDKRTNAPLPAAVVRIKGTTHSVVTDNNGAFKFLTGQRVRLRKVPDSRAAGQHRHRPRTRRELYLFWQGTAVGDRWVHCL